ncbi:squalene--hopene cyclase [Priestia aryabhattai]|uniref:terpene cyclase/mutase family protein n=1 Tax=Priestia aryabhattai TaxID=412384 RepID=UPI001C8E0A70|nr:prenyltransferase/squalene oxidase repeat-containing protein [Priestia aryabhattai]MBY0028426.1 squalene--hopene cyclase [Priestia aryabhattai]
MIILLKEVQLEIQRRIAYLRPTQKNDGSFRYCFETGVMPDAFLIMLLRTFDLDKEVLIKQLTERIVSLQNEDGLWTLFDDEEHNLSATIQAYTALLYSGYYQKNDRILRKAERYIIDSGGISRAHFLTRWMLCVNGLYEWPKLFYLPLSLLFVPTYVPLNFYELSTYARIHFVPMMVAGNKKFSLTSRHTPSLSHLDVREQKQEPDETAQESRTSIFLVDHLKQLASLPSYIHKLGYQAAERYMLERIEKDGTLYSYATSTFFMIYGLLALGYKKDSFVVQKAIDGICSLLSTCSGHVHVENSTSTVWDTALLSYALQEAGVPQQDPMIKGTTRYLKKRQHTKLGDWQFHNPNTAPGGWGFSDINTNNPDLDDTSAAIRALSRRAQTDTDYLESWQRGINWLLSMQNKDGGFAAFEKNTDSILFTYLPLENAKDAATDPATADLTGRVLECLGNFAGMNKSHPSIKAAVKWLFDHQLDNGSWYGRWGVCYIYGTWAAITGLRAVGISASDPRIIKAINWLKSIQQEDGGFGESCYSASLKKYVPLPFSTPSQTAWALDALMTICPLKDRAVEKGIKFLLNPNLTEQQIHYPTGIGLPGQFYIQYHSYNDIFPLLALAHYAKKHSS